MLTKTSSFSEKKKIKKQACFKMHLIQPASVFLNTTVLCLTVC